METVRTKLHTREAARRAQEGVTIVEVMIVLVIVALIATGVAVAVVPTLARAKIKQARNDCAVVRSAATMYIADNPRSCPTVEQLVQEGFLQRTARTTDPWDNPFGVICSEGQEPDIYSKGPDGQDGSADDVR